MKQSTLIPSNTGLLVNESLCLDSFVGNMLCELIKIVELLIELSKRRNT